jgi:hypothetical protein
MKNRKPDSTSDFKQKTPNCSAATVRLRKPHPCGGHEFAVVREGPVVTLRCRTCESIIRMTREKYGKAVVRSRYPGEDRVSGKRQEV